MDKPSEPADDQPDLPGRFHGFGGRIGIVLVLLAFYVLSTGPAFRLARRHGLLPERALIAFYSPLIFVSEASRPIDDFLKWYVRDVWAAD